MLQAANMIELGQIRAALVVGTEDGRPLVETTIAALNANETLTRQQVKCAVASLTIGSGSCAILLTDRELSQTGNRLLAAAVRANTDHHQLCQSDRDEAVGSGMQPLMQTDSEQLMQQGVATGAATFRRFLSNARWDVEDIDKTFCHQVGTAHRKLMLESLGSRPASTMPRFPGWATRARSPCPSRWRSAWKTATSAPTRTSPCWESGRGSTA
jgi:acyl-CoA:acyl-CoA alkyltransferase